MRKLPFQKRVTQRSRLYAGRLGLMAMRRPLKEKVLFMHVPKCGGTSVAEGLYATVPFGDQIGLLPSQAIRKSQSWLHHREVDMQRFHDEGEAAETLATFREQIVLMHIASGQALIHGHFLFTPPIREMALVEGYQPITILRDPRKRTISNFRMAQRNGIFEGSFDQFLNSDMGRRMALHGLRYFSGRVSVDPNNETAALEAAKANMAKFAIVGFLEDLGGFAAEYKRRFGSRPRFAHYNSGGNESFELSAKAKARLEDICAPDLELFEWAKTPMKGN